MTASPNHNLITEVSLPEQLSCFAVVFFWKWDAHSVVAQVVRDNHSLRSHTCNFCDIPQGAMMSKMDKNC